MKIYFLALSLFLPGLCLHAKAQQVGIEFEIGNWNSVLAQASKKNKLIFLEVGTSWCSPCHLMAQEVFTQKATGEYFNKHFINFTIDAEKGEGRKVASRYPIEFYPTYLFINSQGKLIYKDHGFCNGDQLIRMGKKAILTWDHLDAENSGKKN
ncbi:MAG: thioredoxin family protein [Chitinophagaceae bacterium]